MMVQTKNWNKKQCVNDNISSFTILTQNIIDTYGLDAKFHNEYIYHSW